MASSLDKHYSKKIKVIEKMKPIKQSHTSLRDSTQEATQWGRSSVASVRLYKCLQWQQLSRCFPHFKKGDVKIKFQALAFVSTVGSLGT